MILDFLARLLAEADILGMSEGQAFVALPYYSRGIAEDQFNSIRGSCRPSEEGFKCWPEAGQYLLRSYATENAIQGATRALCHTKQSP